MPFMHFLYFLPRLSILLILIILPHMSPKPGHMARFNVLYAPHVHQHRTLGALQRPKCPTCPSAPDTWRTWTVVRIYKDVAKVGQLREAEEKACASLEKWRSMSRREYR